MARPGAESVDRDSATPTAAPDRPERWLTWLLLIGSVAVCLPFLRTIYWLGDEGLYLGGAQRLIAGLRLYKNIFEVTPPFGFLVTAFWLRIFGQTLVAARVLAILVEVGIVYWTYRAASRVCGNRLLCAALAFAWLVMSQGFLTQIAHHWFTTLFAMIAVDATLRGEDHQRRPIVAGLASGAAMMVTTTRGFLCVAGSLICFFWRQTLHGSLRLVVALAVVPLLMLAYVVEQGIFHDAYFDLLTFTSTRYSGIQWVPFGSAATMQNAALIGVFPGAALALLVTAAVRGVDRLRDYNVFVCVLYAGFGLIGCFPRCDIYHIIVNVPLALPLVAWTAQHLLGGRMTRSRGYFAVALCAVLLLPSARGYYRVARDAFRTPTTRTSAGDVKFINPAGEPELMQRLSTIGTGDRLTAYPYIPLVPFLDGHPQQTVIDEFLPEYSTVEQYDEACRAMVERTDWVVAEKNWASGPFLKAIFPRIRDAQPPEKQRIERVMASDFTMDSRFGNYTLFKRKPWPSRRGQCPTKARGDHR